MRQRLAQLVFTLTQFESVVSVRVRIDGVPTTTFGTSGVTLDAPLGRHTFTDETPFILLETVAPGDVVKGGRAHLAGLSNTFESNVRIRIVGADGRVLADTFTTGKGSMGTWGQFEVTVAFDRGTNTAGKVVVFENSAKDGTEINAVEVPVRFA
jgi:germination protein M